ncbi:MAG: ParA family protein [Comamonadaceae bacterium]
MHVYALSLEKGGCGKTALAINIAAAFQQIGLRVLLIDLDAQASATHWLGVDSEALQADESVLGVLNDAMKNRVSAQSVRSRVRETDEGVHLLAAHGMMASLPAQLSSAPLGGLFLLKQVFTDLAQATDTYDVVVLDLPPARGPVLAMALAASTRCLAPVQPEDLVVRALKALITSVQQVQANGVNPDLQLSIIRNKYAPRSNGDRIFDQLLRDHYASQMVQAVFPIRAVLRDSAAMQQTVFRYTGTDATEVRALFLHLIEELMVLDGRG